MKPPMPYFGGKHTIAPSLVSLLPAHEHYVEPFAGGLSVLLAKSPSKMETVNDLDGDLMNFWRVLRDRPDDLIRACALTPHSRTGFLEARERPEGLDDLERARRLWVHLSQSRSASGRRTGWRYYVDPHGSSIGMPGYIEGYVDRMAAVAQRLHRVSLESRDALEVVAEYGRHRNALLYVDPPYLGSTRSSRSYVHEMPREDQHRDLAAALHECKASVVLSGYASALYDDLFADWPVRVELAAATGNGNGYSKRVEVVWSNRPLAVAQTFDFEEAS